MFVEGGFGLCSVRDSKGLLSMFLILAFVKQEGLILIPRRIQPQASCGKGHLRGTCLGSALLRSKNDGTELLLRLLVENDKEISFQADINRSSKAKTWS